MFDRKRVAKSVAGVRLVSLGQSKTFGVTSSFAARENWKSTKFVLVPSDNPPPSDLGTFHGYFPSAASPHSAIARPISLRLFTHATRFAFSLARARAGNNKEARIAMIATTTSNSISVNAHDFDREQLISLRLNNSRYGASDPVIRKNFRAPPREFVAGIEASKARWLACPPSV